jgi:hypothetical protein
VGPTAAAALLALALGGVDGTAVDVRTSGRTETSALAFASGGGAVHGLAALDVLPRVGLLLDHRTLRLELAYEPQLRASESLSYAASDATLVHGGAARAVWELSPLWKVAGTARAAVRILDFAAVGAGDLGRLLDVRRAPAVFRFRDDAASAGLEGRPTRLLTVGVTASVASSGGGGAAGAGAVPGLREARGAASVARAWTEVDTLHLELSGAAATFDLGDPASLASASLGWTRRAARAVTFHLLAAASGVRDRTTAGRAVGGGEAGVEATAALLGRPLALSAAVRAGPAFDRFVARVQERAGLDLAATWAVTPRWSVGAAGAYARVREPLGYSAARGDLRAEWKATPRVALYADVWREEHREPLLGPAGAASYLGTSVGVVLAPVPP